jgi:hypothetical protein
MRTVLLESNQGEADLVVVFVLPPAIHAATPDAKVITIVRPVMFR